ncbi:MAG: GIY-YIG nuclease family protein [Verrucomicrobiae bacterium]|nr:GIY-YIG nuclease family protein [Verrucomicrobiae bacterium]
MYYVYILYSLKDRRTYAGFTPDLKNRLEKHNQGLVKATRHRRFNVLCACIMV